jgi:hypothetical protein
MTAVVKCERRELELGDILRVGRARLFENYTAVENDEIFLFWHDHGIEKAQLASQGVLLTSSDLERSSIHSGPEASLEIKIERSAVRNLLVEDLTDDGEIRLYRKTGRDRRSKIATLSYEETDFLRDYFQDQQPTDDVEAEEGYRGDRTTTFLSRNASIIVRRKERDGQRCQVCEFRVEVHGKYIIDCHHKYPLTGVVVTRLDDLVCLCPSCHRIAHTRKSPLTLDEIRSVRHAAGLP